MKKLFKKIKKLNPFKIKVGESNVKWRVSPNINKEDIKKGNIKGIGEDLLSESEYNVSIDAPISPDVDLNLDYKGKLNNSDTNINVKFTKKF